MKSLRIGSSLVVFILLAACKSPGLSAAPEAQTGLTTIDLCVMSQGSAVPVHAEVARSWSERRIGLMGRKHLEPAHGMLFLYDDERAANQGFWMKGTLIPLDIAYLGRDGEILAVQTMAPCHEVGRDCPTYSPGVRYWSALETNAGFFDQHSIEKGGSVKEMSPGQCRQTLNPG